MGGKAVGMGHLGKEESGLGSRSVLEVDGIGCGSTGLSSIITNNVKAPF